MLGTQCTEPEPAEQLEWQGHRGARGIFPENTWPSFQYALEQGMHTLEMDVVLTRDREVVLSHEPYLNPEICLDSTGRPLHPDGVASLNIYRMTYRQLMAFDCGSKPHPRFPQQHKVKLHKPLLQDIIRQAERYERHTGPVHYNIEVKSRPDRDRIFYPGIEAYTDAVVDVISRSGIFERAVLQSFDPRVLRYAHRAYPELKLAYLVEEEADAEVALSALGFTPAIYSCAYSLVSPELVRYCHDHSMRVIPWTVNRAEEIRQLIAMKVDGVITDYPDLKKEVSPSGK